MGIPCQSLPSKGTGKHSTTGPIRSIFYVHVGSKPHHVLCRVRGVIIYVGRRHTTQSKDCFAKYPKYWLPFVGVIYATIWLTKSCIVVGGAVDDSRWEIQPRKAILEGKKWDGNCRIVNYRGEAETVVACTDEIDGWGNIACKEVSKTCIWKIWFGLKVVAILVPNTGIKRNDFLRLDWLETGKGNVMGMVGVVAGSESEGGSSLQGLYGFVGSFIISQYRGWRKREKREARWAPNYEIWITHE